MHTFKISSFSNTDIIAIYIKKYGWLILFFELCNILIFYETFFHSIYNSLFAIIIAILPAYRFINNNRIIYQIDIWEEDRYIVLHYFVLLRAKRKIPFEKLHTECMVYKSLKDPKFNMEISFWKKSLPVGFIQLKRKYIPSSKNWSREQLVEISQALYEIKQKYPTYKKDIWYSRWQYGWERVDKFKKQDNMD